MKAEEITIRGDTGWQEVQVANKSDSIFFSADRRERAEKRRQELIDALPKPRWTIERYNLAWRFRNRDEESVTMLQCTKAFAERLLMMLNEAEE